MTEHDLTAHDFGTIRTATKTHSDETKTVDVRTSRWADYGYDRLYINDLFTSSTDVYADLDAEEVVVDGTKTRTTSLDVDGDELVITIKRPSVTYELRVEIESIDIDDEDETEECELVADGGRTTAERADDIDEDDFDLSKREVAELAQHGPEDRIGDLNQEAYDVVIDAWQNTRPEDLARLEDAKCFDWSGCYWELGDPQGRGTEFEIITDVEYGLGDDEAQETHDLAWELVSDWVDEFYRLVAALQKKSNFGRQEFRTYWLSANLSKSAVAAALDVSLPTRKGYWDRAINGIERADATKQLEFDDKAH